VVQGVYWLYGRFRKNNIVFKTTLIRPNPEKENYDHCILPGGEIIPIANPVLMEEKPKNGAGAFYNITFTVTNNTNKELLIDKIEAYLVKYETFPEKYIVARGPQVVLRPIDLYLKLDPDKDIYDLLGDKCISIEAGKTEHQFLVWVCGIQPGIYRFKIRIVSRIAGNENKIIESDMLYSYSVPEKPEKAVYLFGYRKKIANDPIFREIFTLLKKPTAEFKTITSSWGKYKFIEPPGGMAKYYRPKR
jgi:hypothetical protein